jgi:hypothetical protein
MKINDGSKCSNCEYFEHECDVPFGEDDYGCVECCKSTNDDVKDNFYESDDVIKECEGFKR